MDRKTIQTYDKLAQEYDKETRDFWNRFPSRIIDEFVESLKSKVVLDVGSGPGRDGLLLKERGCTVTCLDASKSMVALCQSAGLNAIQADFNELPFTAKSFDGVWSYTALLHVPKSKIDQALNEISRVLKPKGVLGIGMIEGKTEGYRESAGVNKPRWFTYYTRAELESLFEKHALEVTFFHSFTPHNSTYLNYICIKK